MKILGEAGILGFTAFIALIYTVFKEEVRVVMTPVKDEFVRGIAVGLVPATVACLPIYNLTGDYMLVHRFMGVFWIMLALILKYSWAARHTGVGDAE
jgi:O-antigen ligase